MTGIFGLDVAQGRDRWRDAVSAVMNIQIPEKDRNFLIS
jgi:hypothetical protein